MKTKVISVRVSADEYELLVRDAKDTGKVSRLVRAQLLAGSTGERRRERLELLCGLERVRANLVALARWCEGVSAEDAVKIMATLVAAEEQLERLADSTGNRRESCS